MASSKESPQSSRPISQHRLSISNANSLSKSHNRIQSHPSSTGSLIPSHRVTRRKSVSTNTAVMAVVAKEVADTTQGIPITVRKSATLRSNSSRSSTLGSLPSLPMSLPTQKIRLTFNGKTDRGEESAIDDNQMDDISIVDEESGSKPLQARRASEGQHLMKEGKKSSSSDLKCVKCGKEYKHSSCLSKHLFVWEHTPEWSYTSKLLISKHQQVQLLEAASVLLTMTQDVNTTVPSAQDYQSDHDSTSVSSEQHDHLSSADTTPPYADIFNTYSNQLFTRGRGYKRYNDGQSLSHSHQSTSSTEFFGKEKNSNTRIYEDYGDSIINGRPNSSGNSNNEDESLASAVQLLSCSFGSTGTPKPLAESFFQNTPPVPDIPACYLDHCDFPDPTFTPCHHPQQKESYTRSRIDCNKDVQMDSGENVLDDDEQEQRSLHGRSDEDDDGIFGSMEE
ncbi:hypothetical protein GcM3_019020 [Golovinomyces cichoracearum]|uniref:C2H2-type domain-containing protein n=1 Tax=Golovinomyces cichoracearum TaxID=62708 RepID=A0A420J800_9PEZI|nr:hypothetical protein GcM3_019020 [Golovinomyces cichoracearum]